MAHLLGVEDATVSFPTHTVLDRVTLGIGDGQRIGIVGRNGDGKTTLLRLIAGDLTPDSGAVVPRRGLRVGYLSQRDDFPASLEVGQAIVGDTPEHVWASNPTVRQVIDGLVADLDWRSPIGSLSGGQARRVALAALLVDEWDILILDEPTNHLDLATREALAVALNEFEGTVMLVSHDRALLRSVCDEFWLVGRGVVKDFDGDLDDYQRYLLDEAKRVREANAKRSASESIATDAVPASAGASKDSPSARPKAASAPPAAPAAAALSAADQRRVDAQRRQQLADQTRPLRRELAKAEERMDAIGAERGTLEAQLSQPLPSDEIAQAGRRLKALGDELDQLEARWLELSDQLQTLEQAPAA